MAQLFLKAQKKYLIILTLILPCVGIFIFMPAVMLDMIVSPRPIGFSGGSENGFILITWFLMYIVILFLGLLTWYGWVWSIGMGLQKKLPKGLRVNKIIFTGFLIIPFSMLNVILFSTFWTVLFGLELHPFYFYDQFNFMVLMVHFILSIIGSIYIYICCARVIKSIQSQRKVKLWEYFDVFITFIFYFIAIFSFQHLIQEWAKEV